MQVNTIKWTKYKGPKDERNIVDNCLEFMTNTLCKISIDFSVQYKLLGTAIKTIILAGELCEFTMPWMTVCQNGDFYSHGK